MLVETIQRLAKADFQPPLIVGSEKHREAIEDALGHYAIAVEAVVLEPVARNTSAAAALAAQWLLSNSRDDLLLLLPSDHVIADSQAFLEAIRVGTPHAEDGAIVTFGVVPTHANVEYGYIEGGAPGADGARSVARFVEKPDADTAATYVESGRFFWNSGMFLVKASTLIGEMLLFLPASLESISRSLEAATRAGIFVHPQPEAFGEAENISIDNGIMERTSRGVVIPVEMGWSDIGSWAAVWKHAPKDEQNNAVQGQVMVIDTCNSLLRNESATLLTAVGLDHMAVIAVGDAILVTSLSSAADVKLLVDKLRNDAGGSEKKMR